MRVLQSSAPQWSSCYRYLSATQPVTASAGTKLSGKNFDLSATVAHYEEHAARACANRRINSTNPVFRIALPPPNVTGDLHLGHALTATLEDALCRYNRMCGREVIWYPGFDHAGIATQAIVEKELWKEKKIRRHQISQKEFLHRCNQWKDIRISTITRQLKRLGATLEWGNCYYTMDQHFSNAVVKAFCRLHSEGLIFRDRRLIHWCPTLQSTVSDEEVDHIEVGNLKTINVPGDSGERLVSVGEMHHVRYEVVSSKNELEDFLEVATTRPETIFADVALAVHPNDFRYSRFIGRFVYNPLLSGRKIPVIGDEAVKPDKGTGVLKITPSHDFTDFEIATRHIEILGDDALRVSCIDEKGCLKNAPGFDCLDRFDARNKVLEKLKEIGAYGGQSVYSEGRIAVCSRTGDVVEPMMREQWFLNCEQMNDEVLEALSSHKLKIVPGFLQAKLEEWLNNKNPWCLSRQLIWGHRVPAFRLNKHSDWFVAEDEATARSFLHVNNEDIKLDQDTDVLDTWFSSALVPIVLAGWPERRIEGPFLSIMETGYDIIGFWVARMLTVCLRLTGHLPFYKIMLHGLVRDSSGRKMSKSLGNVISPSDVIDGIGIEEMINRVRESTLSKKEKSIAVADLKKRFPVGINKCGPDALRFALLRHDVSALDVNLNIGELAEEGFRFCNKLWNLCTYALKVRSEVSNLQGRIKLRHPVDRWIRSRLESTLQSVHDEIAECDIHLAFEALRMFILADLCDVYLETTKKALWSKNKERLLEVSAVLQETLEKSLTALSAFMPFISGYLFDHIKTDTENLLSDVLLIEGANSDHIDEDLEYAMSAGVAAVSAIRSLRNEIELPQKVRINVSIVGKCDLSSVAPVIEDLANVTLTEHSSSVDAPALPVSVSGFPLSLELHLEDEYSEIILQRLHSQLKRCEVRKKKFEEKAVKYERLCSNGKLSVIEKNKRKALQARNVAIGVAAEIEKLKSLLKRLKAPSCDHCCANDAK